jgi:hypothetical protein
MSPDTGSTTANHPLASDASSSDAGKIRDYFVYVGFAAAAWAGHCFLESVKVYSHQQVCPYEAV